jgi:DNA-binding NtrC family response regulator
MMPRVLLIDDQWGLPDDPMFPERYGSLPIEWLREAAGSAAGLASAKVALSRVKSEAELTMVLLDVDFGRGADRLGVEILTELRRARPTLPVVMFTSLGSQEHRELVIGCMELGANEYLEKAPSAQRMLETVNVYADLGSDQALYGNSAPIRRLRASIARVAFSGETSVLIVGPSGCGKELVARSLHRQGPKKAGAFVAKNCAHADLQLLESELFGHEKGAFTGATAARRGLLEEADGGVLFLDEIADMPPELQGKLLRALETRCFRRVGGSRDIESSFQLVCATNRRPEELLDGGRFRDDLFYRISTMTLHVPALSERRDDIPILAELFLRWFKRRGGASYPGVRFLPGFVDQLMTYSWPGNVRELRNAVERAVILSRGEDLGPAELPDSLAWRTLAKPESRFASEPTSELPAVSSRWAVIRLIAELRLAVAAKERVKAYKGAQWKAEFMRLMYPDCKAANAKGFEDLVKRLTKGPWSCPALKDDPEAVALLDALKR